MREVAASNRVPIFSRAELMRTWEAAGVGPLHMLHADGLHHNDRGYACLAEALAESILRGLGAAAPPARVAATALRSISARPVAARSYSAARVCGSITRAWFGRGSSARRVSTRP